MRISFSEGAIVVGRLLREGMRAQELRAVTNSSPRTNDTVSHGRETRERTPTGGGSWPDNRVTSDRY